MADHQAIWAKDNLQNPHAVADKAKRVRAMFAAIAPRYDLNNRLHSLGRDQAWRRAAVRLANIKPSDVVLDMACGTGDLAIAFARSGVQQVLGVDFTLNMLNLAKIKPAGANAIKPRFQAGDAMRQPITDHSVDVVSIAFGIRNVAQPARAIAEFYRVLKPGGRVLILEFSEPNNRALRWLYHLYFRHVMPVTASIIAGDRSGAYRYLPKSVSTFIDQPTMLGMIGDAGFVDAEVRRLTMGIAVIYRGYKPGHIDPK